jgi:hypothetical protein|uniref:Uncharacterized protein n=1 Tax=viral metagenome TaxID=1070528 RepID=A0A6C0IW91_9ZZZZ
MADNIITRNPVKMGLAVLFVVLIILWQAGVFSDENMTMEPLILDVSRTAPPGVYTKSTQKDLERTGTHNARDAAGKIQASVPSAKKFYKKTTLSGMTLHPDTKTDVPEGHMTAGQYADIVKKDVEDSEQTVKRRTKEFRKKNSLAYGSKALSDYVEYTKTYDSPFLGAGYYKRDLPEKLKPGNPDAWQVTPGADDVMLQPIYHHR